MKNEAQMQFARTVMVPFIDAERQADACAITATRLLLNTLEARRDAAAGFKVAEPAIGRIRRLAELALDQRAAAVELYPVLMRLPAELGWWGPTEPCPCGESERRPSGEATVVPISGAA